MKKTKKQFRNYEDELQERLADAEYARAYLEAALEEYSQDNDLKAFLLALKDVTIARGGIQKIAKQAKLNRQNLYRVLSAQSDPKINTVGSILNSLGFQLTVRRLPKSTKSIKTASNF